MHFRSAISSLGLLAAAAFVNAAPLKVARQSGVPKVVVAHHIVGLTAAFTVDDWTSDMTLAKANGIDGFALNVGNDPFTTTQAQNAYQAAEALDFKLFFSLDMSSFPCTTADDATKLRDLTMQFATSPSQLQVDGKAFVSTFAGEACTFGQADPPSGWRTQFTQHPETTGKVHFVPSFFIDPATFNTFTGVMDGDFNFNSGWPLTLSAAQAPQLLPGVNLNAVDASGATQLQKFIGSFDTDDQHITQLATVQGSAQTYMAAVAPWFFTHFGADTFNKNFVFDGDEHLWVSRWENVIANRDKVSLVEIVTWNDFGESHYIGPNNHGQLPPGSDAWVNGFDHQGFLDLTNYFATQFKTGQAPPITKDQLVMWARPHPKNATPNDPVGAPKDFQLFQDKLWAVVLATADGELTLATSDTTTQTFPVTAGVNKLSLDLTPGGFMHGTLVRNGATVIDLKPADYTFNPNPSAFNYNAFTASASSQ
ncbi:glycoside hydrolase [Trametes versicolor FP-101664 SS1]|uniref:glycoside hydrolase n=1 Tax=Trametes versicolor (strain FP-101664) TaxID=717944 RepID=UPI000462384E|nr:glycoside hydrolase [Trametes versicolor FP-101664 SS1]EIW59482.1 glycoside hydrolase [Trametes versicolor FP-101664 SS1]